MMEGHEKPKQAWCMVCGKRRPLRDMNHIPALGYTCKKRFGKTCKPKETLLEGAQRMLKDPAYRYMIASEKEKSIYAEINDLKEWLRKRDERRSYTMEGSYLDINTIIAEIDRR
jgi:hypothetical protein